jgi:hypothetical protein
MGCVFRYKARQIIHLGILDRQPVGNDDFADFFACAPQIDESPIGIIKRGIYGVTAVKFGIAAGNCSAAAALALMGRHLKHLLMKKKTI